MTDNAEWLRDTTGNQWAWALIGIPAVLGWLAIGIGWLVAPRLTVEIAPLVWGMFAVAGWYGLLICCVSGWAGLFVLMSLAG